MSLFTPSLMQATDNNGNPISGAKWWFYLSGSSTPVNVYSDSTATTSLGSSVTADASGWFVPIYFAAGVDYRAVLKTPAGATIGGKDIDPVDLGGSSGGDASFVTVESFGATGTPGTDDRAAIQAAIDYALTNGIPEVRFMQDAYDCKAGTHVAGGFGDINPTGAMMAIDGSLAPTPASIRLYSPSGKTIVRRIGYNTGGDPNTDYQTFASNPYRGGGIYIYGTQANDSPAYEDPEQWAIQRFELDGLTIEGNTGVGGLTGTSTDTSDKGIFWHNAVREVVLRNGAVHGFYHELLYGGAVGYGSGSDLLPVNIYIDNFEASGSGHTAFNIQQADGTITNSRFGNAYIAAEQYGNNLRWNNVTFFYADQLNFSAADQGWIPSGVDFAFPSQSDDKLRINTLSNIVCDRVSTFYVGPYTYGDVHMIDGTVGFFSWAGEIDLKVTTTLHDANHMSPLIFMGSNPLPTGTGAAYYMRNVHIDLDARLSRRAQELGYGLAPINIGGWLDPETCSIRVRYGWAYTGLITSYGPGVKAMPRIIVDKQTSPASYEALVPGSTPGGGLSNPYALNPWQIGHTFYPTTPGHVVTLTTLGTGTGEGFAHGQEYNLYCYDSGSNTVTINDASNVKLRGGTRTIANGEKLTLWWDRRLGKWTDYGIDKDAFLSGSATYDAPSIAAGGTTTTTITVTGAALGDMVDKISFGVDLTGLTVTGYVSAADTVTLVLVNPTAGAIDLASTTVRATVQKV